MVTKAPFVNLSINQILHHAKVPVRFFGSHSYLEGVTAAELWRVMSNINMIFSSWKIRKITELRKLFGARRLEVGSLFWCCLVPEDWRSVHFSGVVWCQKTGGRFTFLVLFGARRLEVGSLFWCCLVPEDWRSVHFSGVVWCQKTGGRFTFLVLFGARRLEVGSLFWCCLVPEDWRSVHFSGVVWCQKTGGRFTFLVLFGARRLEVGSLFWCCLVPEDWRSVHFSGVVWCQKTGGRFTFLVHGFHVHGYPIWSTDLGSVKLSDLGFAIARLPRVFHHWTLVDLMSTLYWAH